MKGQPRDRVAALLFGLLWLAGCAAHDLPAAASREAAVTPGCVLVPGESAAGPMQLRVGDSVQTLSSALPGRVALQRYASIWPDAVALAPSGAPVLIVLSAQDGELHLLDRESGSLLKKIAFRDRAHGNLTYAGAVESGFRRSVLIRFEQAELWELFLMENGPAIYEGLVHDFRMGEGLREPPQYPIRRIALEAPILSMVPEPGYANLLFTQSGADGFGRLVRFNLDVRRPIGQVQTRSSPGKLSLGQAGEIRFVALANAGSSSEVFRIPDLAPLDWRTLPVDACRAR